MCEKCRFSEHFMRPANADAQIFFKIVKLALTFQYIKEIPIGEIYRAGIADGLNRCFRRKAGRLVVIESTPNSRNCSASGISSTVHA